MFRKDASVHLLSAKCVFSQPHMCFGSKMSFSGPESSEELHNMGYGPTESLKVSMQQVYNKLGSQRGGAHSVPPDSSNEISALYKPCSTFRVVS